MNYCGNLAVKLETRNAKYLDQNLWYRMWERWLIDAHQSPLVHELKEREILISNTQQRSKTTPPKLYNNENNTTTTKVCRVTQNFSRFLLPLLLSLILFCFVWSAGNRKPFLFCFTELFFFFFFSFFFFLFLFQLKSKWIKFKYLF